MSKLNFAILGFGKMGSIRYKILKEMNDCEVSWIYEINPKISLPEDVKHAKEAKEIFEDRTVNAVLVCVSNDAIKESVVKALRSGKHVFCEKPPGRNMVELQEIMDAESQKPGLKLMFGFNHRHHESVIQAKKLIDSGGYGRILWIRGRYGKSVDRDFFSNWRAKKELAGGGILLDQGIHMLDLFLMMCDDFEEVKAYVSNLYWNLDIEDNVFAVFRNKKGQVASLHSTMTQWRHLFSLEIFLERGYLTINGLKTSSNTYGDEILSVAKNRTSPPSAMWTDEEKTVFHSDNSWKRELEVFTDSIKHNKKVPMGNTEDALRLMRLIERIYSQND